jgi:hypothetical protein
MGEVEGYFTSAILIGAGATAVMDLWAVARKRLRGVAPADYGLVGRWLGHMLKGRFRHHSISAASRMPGERLIGWTAHYFIGIAFAFVLLALWGMDWVDHPTIGPALFVGLGSVAAPFLLMQPGMGAGVAASRTPNPTAARVRSLTTHAVFGVGLYVAAWLLSLVRG